MSAAAVTERRAAAVLALALAAAAGGCGGDAPSGGDVARPVVLDAPEIAAQPWFVDITEAAGIDFVHHHGGSGKKFLFETMGSGVAASDLDGDGRIDLLFLQSGTLPAAEFSAEDRERAGHAVGLGHRLYLNRGAPGGELRFEDATAGSGLEEPVYAMGVSAGDVDADGDRDLYIACYGRERLHRNDGAARFTDATAAAGLGDARWNMTGVFLDGDLDGDLDLYTVAYLDMPIGSHKHCGPDRKHRTYCHVDTWPGLDDRWLLNDGSGRFTDASDRASIVGTAGKGLAAIAGDVDDDGDPDLFVANDSQANLMLRNDGGGRFSDVSAASGTDLNGDGRTEACMGVDLGDLDGDLHLDLYVVNFEQETNTLYRNDGGGLFTDVSASSGAGYPSLMSLGFGTAFLDVENDGDLDIYVANGHILDNVAEVQGTSTHAQVDQLYLNGGRGRFTLAPASTAPSLAEPRVGRGVARADLDGDGDDDLVVTNSGGRPWVLRNDLGGGHRLALELRGPGGRADAEGARVTVGAGGRKLLREWVSGGTYLSQHGHVLNIGLGDATRVERLVIRWPGGATSEHVDLPADRRLVLAFGGDLVLDEPLDGEAPVGR